MRFMFCLLIVCLIAAACNNNAAKLREKLASADSFAINFYSDKGSMDSVTAVAVIRDKSSIEKLTDFITADETGDIKKCLTTGSIHYFKNDQVIQDIYFSAGPNGCEQFSFVMKKKKVTTVLTAAAAAYLQAVQTGTK